MENKYKLDETKLTPEQRDQLEAYRQTEKQLQSLQDIADMTHEVINLLSDANKNTDKIEALGALLRDTREQLVTLNKKEAPEAPDYAKPIVAAISKLENSLPKAIKAPQVNVAAPSVHVDAPDLTEFTRILRTEIPSAFQKAIKSIPKVEVYKPDFAPLLSAWEGISEQLVSIENATRMKPLPGSIRVSNLSEIASGSGSSEVDYSVNDLEEAATSYYGKSNASGAFLILKVTATSVSYATVTNNGAVASYTDAWTNRATLTYGRKDQAF